MNEIELRLTEILSTEKDIALCIIRVCENLSGDDRISLSLQLQTELITRLYKCELEEEVWDSLLSVVSPNALSEDVFNYLIQNNISIITLCHMDLQDDWLIKLSVFDNAPLYTLATRYYTLDKYSLQDFRWLYDHILISNNDIVVHLLDIFGNTSKRSLLISLCSDTKDFEYKEFLEWHRVADQVRDITDGKTISSIYVKYSKAGTVLNEIAKNYNTPEEILMELSSIKGIKDSRKIRNNSLNTLSVIKNKKA